jgi:hypothetical protein
MTSCLWSVFVLPTLACAEASRLPMDISLSCRTVRSTRQRLSGTTACGGGQTSLLSPFLRRLRAARVLSVPLTRSGGAPPPCPALRHKSAYPALFATLCQHFYLCLCMCAGRFSLLTSHAWVFILLSPPPLQKSSYELGLLQILLPPSAGASLLNQDASKNGTYFFQLSNGSGRVTHAGLLEFSSAEGFVALPRKVIRCLWGPNAREADCDGQRVRVAYRRLPKGAWGVWACVWLSVTLCRQTTA